MPAVPGGLALDENAARILGAFFVHRRRGGYRDVLAAKYDIARNVFQRIGDIAELDGTVLHAHAAVYLRLCQRASQLQLPFDAALSRLDGRR